MAKPFPIEELMEELDRYLAAVELFRALGDKPSWRAELDSERRAAATGRAERPLRADIRLHRASTATRGDPFDPSVARARDGVDFPR